MVTWVPSADAAWQRPQDWAAFYHAGYRFFLGYGGLGSEGKWTTKHDIDGMFAHNVSFIPIGEAQASRALTAGESGGKHDAEVTRNYFHNIGVPSTVPIIACMDENVTMDQVRGPVAEYVHGWNSGDTCKCAFYIENDGIDYLYGQGLISYGFQPAAWRWGQPATPTAWSLHARGRQEHNGVNLAGGKVDIGHVDATILAYRPHASVPVAPAPHPVYVATARYTDHDAPWNSTLGGIAHRERVTVSRLLALNPGLHGNANVIPYPGKIRVK